MEENKKGNTLYAVLGVATLVVAIIGATFAYFSASASNTDVIQGGTSNVSLDLSVTRVLFDVSDEVPSYNNLVPAKMDVSTTGIQKVLDNKCVADGYTGCHLYKITASSSSALNAANLSLYSFKTDGATDTSAWKFVVFTGAESTSDGTTTYTMGGLITDSAQGFTGDASSSSENTGYSIYNSKVDANDVKVFYLLVYLEDNDQIQNSNENDNAQYNATGTYTGSVAFTAADGKITANFTSNG